MLRGGGGGDREPRGDARRDDVAAAAETESARDDGEDIAAAAVCRVGRVGRVGRVFSAVSGGSAFFFATSDFFDAAPGAARNELVGFAAAGFSPGPTRDPGFEEAGYGTGAPDDAFVICSGSFFTRGSTLCRRAAPCLADHPAPRGSVRMIFTAS